MAAEPQRRTHDAPGANGAAVDAQVLSGAALLEAVAAAVASTEVIDVHTHLFPPAHGALMLWGVDHLLTYHYLVAELFTVAQPAELTPASFFARQRREQADLVWKHLFVDRLPMSEACRGVITTLTGLGFRDSAVLKRDLGPARAWSDTADPGEVLRAVFKAAGVRYAVMTNEPFKDAEAREWEKGLAAARGGDDDGAGVDETKAAAPRDGPVPVPPQLRAALRVDPVLCGAWDVVKRALTRDGFPATLEGVKGFLRRWIRLMSPVYVMASVPHDFVLDPALDKAGGGTDAGSAASSSSVPTAAQLLREALIPVARECKLPVALKIGAQRGVNPALREGGDAVRTVDLSFLRQLATEFSDVKFLATVLSRGNQHELAVLARKFGNLHVYGCWWFCNTPTIIHEVTSMRIELLGTAFTAQHSDARVLDQLVYKWAHSRQVLTEVLQRYISALAQTGWPITRAAVQSTVQRVLGGSYEEFLAK